MPACWLPSSWASFGTSRFLCARRCPASPRALRHSRCRTPVLQRPKPAARIQFPVAAKGPDFAGLRIPAPRLSGSMSSARSEPADAMPQRMVWVDLEMTGLDIEKDQIIEMACIITDADLNILAEGPNLIINQSDELLDGMSDWCKEHHGQSGLTQAVRESRISLQQAEYEFLSFIRQHTPPGQCPLAGNSVHADKKFLDKYMTQFMHHLHYRIIDVSTIKELCRRWFPQQYKLVPQKKASHRALDDIQESIRELHFYRANVFKSQTEEHKRRVLANGDGRKGGHD